jgi:hypothetical protein
VSSLALAVIAGLVVGSVFVAAFAVQFYPSNNAVLIDKDAYQLPKANTERILEIIENNATIVKHYKHKYLTLFAISERHQAGDNCPFGSCARVLIDAQSGFVHIGVNYEKGFVAYCFEQMFDVIYNCAGERLR